MTAYSRGSLVNQSVRSLKPGQMQDIRRKFDGCGSSEEESSPTHLPRRPAMKVPQQQSAKPQRPNISPSRPVRPNVSPTRNPRDDQSPSRAPRFRLHVSPTPIRRGIPVELPPRPVSMAVMPKPTPRVSVLNAEKTDSKAKNPKVPLRPVEKLMPGHEASTGDDSSNRVSKLVGKLQVSFDADSTTSAKETKTQDSHSTEEDEEPAIVRLLIQDRTPTGDARSRPVSVQQRTQMFESTTPSVVASPQKPAKPAPPVRQRSKHGSGDFSGLAAEPTAVKPSDNRVMENASSVGQSGPPPPPRKPPRTHAHDDYMKVKIQTNVKESEKTELTDSYEDVDGPVYKKIQRSLSTDDGKRQISGTSSLKKMKPKRPPPPRKRPFSIAIDTLSFGSSESSDSDSKQDSPFYESLDFNKDPEGTHDLIKHWDLPRMTHPEPVRRSLSDDCIPKGVDEKGKTVYMDPKELIRDDFGYDIYVDKAGYAVPHRLVKRKDSSTDEQEEIGTSKPVKDRMKSKFRRFKNLFYEQDKTPSSSVENRTPVDRGSQKKKLDLVSQKVNQAFNGLQGSFKVKQSEETNTNQPDTEREGRVGEKEIRKRVEYSRSVRVKTGASIRESRKNKDKIYPQLFEHAMIVSLRKDSETGEYQPYVRYKFPEIGDSNVSVPLFCFPDAANFKPSSSSSKSQSYSFVLTNFDGGRVYGYCRRLVPPNSSSKIPEVLCIISPVDSFIMYNTLLEEIEKRRMLSLDLAQELIAAAFGRPLPSPGKAAVIRTLDIEGEMETIYLNRETDSRVDNVNCECLLAALGVDKLLKVFASILLERSVLLCAKHLSILSATIHALTTLLYPFSWQHTYIPVLPSAMIDVVCSPTPYIIGITSSHLQKVMTLPLDENVLVVDLDKKTLVRAQGDEKTLLPGTMDKVLKTALNMCKFDPELRNATNLMISETFLRFFIESVGHYGQNIETQSNSRKTFNKEEFISGASSSSMQELLTWFAETQMFEVFMTTQLEKKDWGNTIEFFQQRIQENQLQARKNRRRALKKPD